MKNTALKLVSVILAVSTCLIFGWCTAKSSQQAANATTVESTTLVGTVISNQKEGIATTVAATTVADTTIASSIKSSQQPTKSITAVPTTQNGGIKFAQIFSQYSLYKIPEIKNIKYADANKQSANVIISSYEDYVSAAEIINAHADKNMPEKDKSFFDTKSVVIHFDRDVCLPEFTSHQFKSISVKGNTMTIEENRESKKNHTILNVFATHVVAAEVNKSDIKSVENIVVKHHDSYN